MNIAIDFDGVILDSERATAYYADYYSHFKLNKSRLKNNTVTQDECFNWTKKEFETFYKVYYMKATEDAHFVYGAEEILQKLKKEGHKLFIVSKRGFYHQFEIAPALKKLKKFKVKFDEVLFGIEAKRKTCEQLNVDIMIEDNSENIEKFFGSNIKILHLRDKNIRKLSHKNVFEVDNWVDIYKKIQELNTTNS